MNFGRQTTATKKFTGFFGYLLAITFILMMNFTDIFTKAQETTIGALSVICAYLFLYFVGYFLCKRYDRKKTD